MTPSAWTLDDAPSLEGRRAVVTGATSGLGYETALGLARLRARVILSGRNEARGQAAVERIGRTVAGAHVGFAPLDLASLDSVARFADNLGAEPLDILVNNAGVMALDPRQTTADGFEMQIGTNYLGHFALTARLMPALLGTGREARVVSLASLAHRKGRLDLDDLQGERHYDPWAAYQQSKLAMLVFAREFQRRAAASRWPLRSVAAHPGWARTEIIDRGPGQTQPGWKTLAMRTVFGLLAQSAEAGAQPILFAAAAPGASPGGYYGPAGFGERRGRVGPSQVFPQAEDLAAASRLWAMSEALTGVAWPAAA